MGYPHAELQGRELWEIGLLKDEEAPPGIIPRIDNQQIAWEPSDYLVMPSDVKELQVILETFPLLVNNQYSLGRKVSKCKPIKLLSVVETQRSGF